MCTWTIATKNSYVRIATLAPDLRKASFPTEKAIALSIRLYHYLNSQKVNIGAYESYSNAEKSSPVPCPLYTRINAKLQRRTVPQQPLRVSYNNYSVI